ncbi:MAG: UDP-N-acetylmuramoyl-tripeptide--D-alanyl-D-alanine ligase [Defluviitaleaceae bacterium]|nr:UDP-N-acetylmuramoyl-tripeptide--D-alanyl-D-alanine ligase [Defluviitaleaceae bacterium]
MQLTIKEICNATLGHLKDEDYGVVAHGVTIDSRENTEGLLFVPIVGEKFDGHEFISEAVNKGATCVLYERDFSLMNKYATMKVPLIKVASTRRALIDLAVYQRNKFNGQIVAITGSAGKTTTKDITASVVSQKYETLKTKGNFNNDIGLPLTLLSLQEKNNAMVLEMGMNHFGEIAVLSNLARPNLCIITNIGDAHIENLGSRSGILKAKMEIFTGLQKNGTVILNGDDSMLGGISNVPNAVRIIDCHMKNVDTKMKSVKKNVVFADIISRNGFMGTVCNIFWNIDGKGEGKIEVQIPLPGDHMVMNALMAFATGLVLDIEVDKIIEGIKAFKPSGYRMAMSKINGVTIVNDTYNASTLSMKATIDMMLVVPGRKVCILGDMFELGEFSEDLHNEIGRYAAPKIDLMLTIGNLSKHIHEGFIAETSGNTENSENGEKTPQAAHFATKEDFLQHWQKYIKPDDTVLLKASRGVALETVADAMIAELENGEK